MFSRKKKTLFSPHQTVKACLQKRRDTAPSAASRGDGLGRCLKVNAVNSIYSSSAPLFFVLSPTQPPKPLHPFPPLFPLSLTPTSFDLFHPFFSSSHPSCPLLLLAPHHPPSVSASTSVWKGHYRRILVWQAVFLAVLLPTCCHYIVKLINGVCVCAHTRFCISEGVCVHVVTDPVFSAVTARLLIGCVCINLEIAQIENASRNDAKWKENYHIWQKINVLTLA